MLLQTVFILIVASMQFLQLQYSTSRVLNKLSILVITGNVFVLLLFNVIIIFFVRKRSIAFLISSFFITVLSIVNYYVASFHGNPFMFSELSNFKTALDVAGNYKYSINGIVLKILFAFVFELSIVFLEILFFGGKGFKFDLKNNSVFVSCFVVITAIVCFIYKNTQINVGFDLDNAARKYGYCFLQINDIENQFLPFAIEPEGYNVNSIKNTQSDYKSDVEKKPDIILIMNETFFDLGICCDIDADKDMFNELYNINNLKHGYSVVPNVGGGTNDSEFELLTSYSMFLMRTGAPFNYVKFKNLGSNSISYLKNMGYTTVAMHCGETSSYSRNKAYPDMGFDKVVLGSENFKQSSYGNRKWLDSDNYNDLIKEYLNRGESQRFIY